MRAPPGGWHKSPLITCNCWCSRDYILLPPIKHCMRIVCQMRWEDAKKQVSSSSFSLCDKYHSAELSYIMRQGNNKIGSDHCCFGFPVNFHSLMWPLHPLAWLKSFIDCISIGVWLFCVFIILYIYVYDFDISDRL